MRRSVSWAVLVIVGALISPAGTAFASGPANVMVSIGLNGQMPNGFGDRPQISGDGRYVVFDSTATNLVDQPVYTGRDVYRHDLHTGTTELVTVALNGGASDGWSSYSWANYDGRYVAFVSDATNLVPNGNSRRDLYVRDMSAGTTELVSLNSSGEPANRASSRPAMSPDGRFVAFNTSATNMGQDTNGIEQV